ncbi:MAG: phosphoribosylformylglycinamidine synthase [Rhodobacteraceae bacterium]|nr:MAG: phosphoribosylformylglycinamidine synthase [Paracoccaceae bacterium]|tara:strand:+ start:2232 stop:2471 length:240 start_codon:yes stop_codon:yes gene_type:complete
MRLIVRIAPKKSILDPQGEAISNSLKSLGFDQINSVRQGKIIEIDLNESDENRGMEIGKEMCNTLLVNKVIEDFSVTIE